MSDKLTKQELSKISLGFNWNPDMSYEEFMSKNKRVSYESGWDLYDKINDRYIKLKYQEKEQ